MNCQASIEENHPVHKEYVKPESSKILHFSPRVDNDGKTIVDHKASSQSEQSIAALGKVQLTCNSLASAHILLTHLILFILAGNCSSYLKVEIAWSALSTGLCHPKSR
jgi:hypothetical protein